MTLAPSALAKTYTPNKTSDHAPNGCTHSDCTLREAIVKANSTPTADKIKLGPKTYKLTLEGSSEDAAMSGDLDVTQDLKIIGAGASKTAVTGAWATTPDRLFEVLGLGTKLKMSGLALHHGDAGTYAGSGIWVHDVAALALRGVNVTSMDEGIAIDNFGTASLERVTIAHNSTAGCCAGFYDESGSKVKMTNVTFSRNHAGADTGAMYSEGTTATLRNVTFSNNDAGTVGGALISSTGPLDLTNVTFSNNKAKGHGGGLYVEPGTTNNLNNVTFTRNVADSGGVGGGDGGGLYNASGGSSPVNIQNSILAGNTDTSGEAPDCGQNSGDAFTSLGHNLIGPGPTGCTFSLGPGDLVGVEATHGLAPLAANGGFTETVALRKTSPAINAGSKKKPGSGGPACDKHDQRGVKRPQGPRCDIGAYERQP